MFVFDTWANSPPVQRYGNRPFRELRDLPLSELAVLLLESIELLKKIIFVKGEIAIHQGYRVIGKLRKSRKLRVRVELIRIPN
jgi:hypothetical protein